MARPKGPAADGARKAPQPPPGARPKRDAATLLGEAGVLQAQGRMREAFAAFQAALAAAPGNPAALAGLGATAVAIGQAELGIGLLRQAAAASPADAAIRLAFGRALAQLGRLKEAAAELRAGFETGNDALAARDLAAVLVRLGEFTDAETFFATAARQLPQRADLHEALARLQYRRDALDEAVASHRRALQLDPGLAKRLNIGFTRHRPDAPAGLTGSDAAAQLRLPDAGIEAVAPPEHGDLQAACQARSLLILDDFLDDPLAHRQHALGLAYAGGRELGAVNFPGIQTAAQDCGATLQRIADALGRELKWDSPDTGAFRISSAADSARGDIHVDSDARNDIYAAVLYLSLPEHCSGGTSFWRHRETGWERRPSAEQLAAQGYASFLDFERRWVPVDRQRPFDELRRERAAAWDCVFEVPMRFNRLVVYRSDFFHAIGELFGDRPENARLVQLFYFEATCQATCAPSARRPA